MLWYTVIFSRHGEFEINNKIFFFFFVKGDLCAHFINLCGFVICLVNIRNTAPTVVFLVNYLECFLTDLAKAKCSICNQLLASVCMSVYVMSYGPVFIHVCQNLYTCVFVPLVGTLIITEFVS